MAEDVLRDRMIFLRTHCLPVRQTIIIHWSHPHHVVEALNKITSMNVIGICDAYYGNSDCNGDELVNIFDVTFVISFLYLGGPPPNPVWVADVNNDSAINIFDVTDLISFLYLGGSEPTCP